MLPRPTHQGNVSMANAQLLCDTKLIDICGRLIIVHDIHGVSDENLNVLVRCLIG